MIQLNKPEDCVGCHACVQICAKKCLVMEEDYEGFLYPKVDLALCTDCGLCEKVCPVIHQDKERKPLIVYAAKNKNEEIRKESSSGGIFTLLAEQIIDEGGIVFGARFDDNWNVIHDFVESKSDLSAFRGSKYVQSSIGNTYSKAKSFLKVGRKVLFSGTPCQIAGLKSFLSKDYGNLTTIDFVCHGVPSPKVWQLYLDTITKNRKNKIQYISFRNKEKGWTNYSFKLKGDKFSKKELGSDNLFMKGFLGDLYLRPSCHSCPSKHLKSGSDFTIADFWGIKNILPDFDDDKGSSVVMISSGKGIELYELITKKQSNKEINFADILEANPSLITSSKKHPKRDFFYSHLNERSLFKIVDKITRLPFILRLKIKIHRMIKY